MTGNPNHGKDGRFASAGHNAGSGNRAAANHIKEQHRAKARQKYMMNKSLAVKHDPSKPHPMDVMARDYGYKNHAARLKDMKGR